MIKFKNVVLEDFSYFLPDNIMTSEAIENELQEVYQRLKLPLGRLEMMSGIKARRFWPNGTLPSDLSTAAARKILDKNSCYSQSIDLLIHASVCRDFLEPSTASVVHSNLELGPECMIFDLSNACLGMISSLYQAASLIELGAIKRALIVSGENGGPLLWETINHLKNDSSMTRKKIKKYIANLTIGSAASALLLSHRSLAPQAPQILGGAWCNDTTANKLCRGDGNPHSLMMETHSEELLHHGIALAKKTWEKTKRALDISTEDISLVIAHQVGIAHEKLTMEAMGLAHRPTHISYDHFGNTGSSAISLTLCLAQEAQKIHKNDLVLFAGIGSALASHFIGVKW